MDEMTRTAVSVAEVPAEAPGCGMTMGGKPCRRS
jgi:hypothetical protein